VIKEGAHWEGGVTMTRDANARPAPQSGNQQAAVPVRGQGSQGNQGNQAQGSIFSKQDREAAPAGERSGEGA
jgi:hypothetical protein